MIFLKNLFLFLYFDPIGFILLYKYILLSYIFNIILVLYLTKNLTIYKRLFYMIKSISFIFLIQIIKLLEQYLNT